MAITLDEFMGSYSDYLKKNPSIPKTYIGSYKTEYGTYELYRSQRITTNENTRMFIASNLYTEKDGPRIFGSYARAQIHIEINLTSPSSDTVVADISIILPTDIIEWNSSMADSLINQGFKLDPSANAGNNRTSYFKRFKDVKDFEYYLNFIDRLSQNLLKYMAWADMEKQGID